MSDDAAVDPEELGAPAWSGDHVVLTGSCSWIDRTLVEDGAERTPDGFRFDVKAYSLLTGHPTRPKSL